MPLTEAQATAHLATINNTISSDPNFSAQLKAAVAAGDIPSVTKLVAPLGIAGLVVHSKNDPATAMVEQHVCVYPFGGPVCLCLRMG